MISAMWGHIGGIAGATVGFIAGNTRGAYYGYKLGRMAGQNKGKGKRVRSRSRSRSAGVGSSRSHGRAGKRARRVVSVYRARSLNQRVRRGKKVRFGNTQGFSQCVIRRKGKTPLMKGLKRILAPRHISCTINTRINTNAQEQGVRMINLFYTGPPSNFSERALGSLDLGVAKDILQLDNAAISGGTDPGLSKTVKFFVKYVKIKSQLVNATTFPVTITLYDILARRDASSTQSPIVDWGVGLTHQSAAGTAVLSPIDYTGGQSQGFPGATPFESQLFCQRNKVVKVTTFELQAGSEHVHFVKLYPNKYWSGEYIAEFEDYAYRTYKLMAVVKGPIVDMSGNGNQVIYGISAVNVITEYRAEVVQLEKQRVLGAKFGNFQADLLGVPQGVGEDTDLVQQDVIA